MLRWSSADSRPANDRALVGLVAGTGLRWGERAGLRWDAVDLDAGTVRVERVVGTVTRKPARADVHDAQPIHALLARPLRQGAGGVR
ncbi:tyrosine-type recombinase/integrase [Microbispora sp. NPDC004025]